jgi:hypothetical protein
LAYALVVLFVPTGKRLAKSAGTEADTVRCLSPKQAGKYTSHNQGAIMNLVETKFASDSGHWYAKDGTPAYTIIGKNGKERNTTLRDARQQNLVPSVTTILKVAASPALEQWKLNNILMAALTMPRIDGETEQEYIARVKQDAQEEGKKAAERGTEIHGWIEAYYKDGITANIEAVYPVDEKVYEHFGAQKWMPEKSFAHSKGYAGKVDLHSPEVVIDFKTKEFDADNLPKPYDDNVMQLAAYRHGLGFESARCANVFVSRTVPGLVHVVEHSQEDLERGLKMFLCLLDYWKIKNKYNNEL